MYIRHLFSLAAVTVLLIFSLAASWEFALHDLLLGDAPALAAGTVAQRWEYVLIATSGALLAWSVCTPISLRLMHARGRTLEFLLERAAVPEGQSEIGPVDRALDHPAKAEGGVLGAELPRGAELPTRGIEKVIAQLVSALERAEADIRAKSTFLANMSHELRTPLNAIIGFSDLMQTEYERDPQLQVPAKHREYARDIHDAGQYLLQLVNDILDLSKIDSGADSLHDDEVRIAEVIDAAVGLVRGRAAECDIEIQIDVPANLPLLRADDRRLKQIFVNLLTNAIKFTPPGGQVAVKAWCSAHSGYVFQVSDNGLGMALADIPKALTPFHQLDNALTRKNDGAGIGLPLTKALAEAHGGSLDLQSRLGQGTTVTIRFPAERVVLDTGVDAQGIAP